MIVRTAPRENRFLGLFLGSQTPLLCSGASVSDSAEGNLCMLDMVQNAKCRMAHWTWVSVVTAGWMVTSPSQDLGS